APAPAAITTLAASLGRFDGAYRIDPDGRVHLPQVVRLPAPGTPLSVPDGCVVVTGGLGGMGMTLAEQFAAAGVRVVLLHRRSTVPPDLAFAAYRCDVTDADQVAAVFATIRAEVGAIRGVIHAAGIAGDGYLLSRSREDYEAVLAPKVTGTWNIHRATLGDDLAFFVLASSRTALTGAPGQSDYTAANAFLNAFARYRRRLGLPALALCWNTWSGVGMAARLAGKTISAQSVLAPDQAYGVLAAALASGAEQVVVAMTDEASASFRITEPRMPEAVSVSVPAGEAEVLDIFREELGYDHPLTREDDFFDLGGDSIAGTQIVARIERSLGIKLAIADLLDSGTLGAILDRVFAVRGDCARAVETDLLDIFREELGYDRPLTREDDFFDLGGDSIAGTQIVARIERSLGIKLAIADLLDGGTLGAIVDRALASRETVAVPGLKSAPERDRYPVGREQLAILYADMASETHLGFNLPAFLILPCDLDKPRLEAALATLIRRHEVLRTSFCDFDSEHPNMIVHPFEGFVLEEAHIPDLSHKDDFIRPFDLRREAAFRVKLLVVAERDYVLFFDIHHALADGRTISLLNAELYRLYHGEPLAPVTAQQKDFAWAQLSSPDRAARDYWHNIYPDELPRLDLPADFPRPPIHTGRGGMYEFALADDLVAGIKAVARREGVTNYHVVLCAWSLLAAAYADRREVVIAVSMDRREEHLNTAGMLASLLPLRFDVDWDRPLTEVLRETKRISNDALRHRGYILNDLLMDLRPPPHPERSPLSEMILSYMNFEFASAGQGLFETLRFTKNASKTDLSIFGSDTGDRIGFALEYYADLFSHANVVKIGEDFTEILRRITSGNADAPLRFVPTRTVPAHFQYREIGAVLRNRVVALAHDSGVSAETVVLAAFVALLSRITHRRDLLVEIAPSASVPFTIDDDMEFDDLLKQTVTGLALARTGTLSSPSGEEAMSLGFAYCQGGEVVSGVRGGRYGLFCAVQDGGDGLAVRFEHDPQILSDETARNWLGYFERFLAGVTEGRES
ncbi:SDR family NAD(P)-dependent oxidoreductase, partial [Magnetospirillum fulvum]